MALVRRLIKDSPLTFAEGDANLVYLEGLATNTGSFATTGSNIFRASQNIVGGTLSVQSATSTAGQFSAIQNTFIELSLQNLSVGPSASADFVVYGNNGTLFDHYLDLGINNSGLASTYEYGGTFLGRANDAYFYHVGGDFKIGNATSSSLSQSLHLFANPSGKIDLSITGSRIGIQKSGSLNATLDVSGSAIITGSLTVTNRTTGTELQVTNTGVKIGNILTDTHPITGSVNITGSLTVTTTGIELQVTNTGVKIGNILTDTHPMTGSLNVSGSITTTGTITAQQLVVQTITSSTEFISGSTRVGSLLTNTHQFTGSVSITGSLSSIGALQITNNVSASALTQLDFGPGTQAGSNLFLQTSGSSGTNAFEIRPYGVIGTDSVSYNFRQPLNPGYGQAINFDKNNSSISILNGNSDGGFILSRPNANGNESRLISGASGTGILGFMTFYTGGSEKARINGSGSLLVGTTTSTGHATIINGTSTANFPSGALYVNGSSSFTSSINVLGNLNITGSSSFTGSLNLSGSFTQTGYTILSTVSQSLNYTNDAAAASGGVPLGGLYRSGSFILIRLV